MSEFVTYLTELFQTFGPVTWKRMFGGYGIYHDGVMFGLVANDTLYMKVDDTNVTHFESRGLPPFEYTKGDKIVKMSYYLAPEEIFDDPEQAALWARRSHDVALKSKRAGKQQRR